MTVLVTGGAGYIGSHTCVELLMSGYTVIIADNLSNSNPESVNRIQRIAGKALFFYEIDICDSMALSRVFTDHQIDCIIHFAGYKAVGESVSRPLKYYRNNIGATLSLCEAMQTHGVKHIIFSSSATVYRYDNPMPLSENAALGCINPYGRTKLICEQILGDLAHADKDISAVFLRYFNPAGAHKSGLIGEIPKGIPNNLMPYICQAAIGKLPMLRVYGKDYDTKDGTGVRDYIHVVDLAKGHVAALDFAFRNKGVQAFNLGAGHGYSVLEVINTFEKVNGVKVPFKFTDRRAGDLPVCYADTRKAETVLGWKAEKHLDEMCADAWRWQTNNPEGYP